MKFSYSKALFICTSILLPALAMAQTTGKVSTIIPDAAVPFLNFTPDSRSGAMGDAGVAISPDVNANFWNPSKLAFLTDNDNVSLSYSPWLRQLVPDISLSYLSYAHKFDDRNTIGASLRYFNYGSIPLTDQYQNNQGTYSPNEFQINSSFARKFGDEFSLALTAGFIHSSYSPNSSATGSGGTAKPGNALSAGVSMFYSTQTQQFGNDAVFSFGANISNIGTKISYSSDGPKEFLPTNLKIGVANTINLDDYNQITFALDLNKLLVTSAVGLDDQGNPVQLKDGNVSVPSSIFSSFSDAPGGFSQQLKLITISPGFEYWYNQTLAVRAGYFYQNASNGGGNHYITLGAGFKYNEFTFDFSYLAARQQVSGLANTLRFTLSASFGGDTNAHKR